jgi:AAA domain
MVGEGGPDDEMFRLLRAWIPDPDKSDKDLWKLIKGAHKLNPQPATKSLGRLTYTRPGATATATIAEPIQQFRWTGNRLPLPQKLADWTAAEFLQSIYNSEDWISLNPPVWEDNRLKPRSKDTATVLCEAADVIIEDDLKADYGGLFRINPVRVSVIDLSQAKWDNGKAPPPDATIRIDQLNGDIVGDTDADIIDYRYGLVELEIPKKDRPAMSLEQKRAKLEQYYAAVMASGLPIEAIYTSGETSLHVLVRIWAGTNRALYDERIGRIYEYCKGMEGFDPSNCNPSRYSRLPGCWRGDQNCKQTLIALYVNRITFEEWEEAQTPVGRVVSGILGSICSISEFKTMQVPPKQQIVGDWFNEGDIGYIFAPRGVGKTWYAFDMAESIAARKEFGPWKISTNCPAFARDKR